MSHVPDLKAIAEQQKLYRQAAELGYKEVHPIIVGLQAGADGIQVATTLVSTCGTCYALVRADYWAEHTETHTPTTATIEDLDAKSVEAIRLIGQRQQALLEEDMRSHDND